MAHGLRLAALLLVGLALAAPARAEEPGSLEELLRVEPSRRSGDVLVSTAGRLAQSADLAAAVTHVVTRQEIERLGLRRFTDVLRRLPGLLAVDGREFSRVNVRGLGPGEFNGRVLFLLDGVRLNENVYDAGQIDLDFLLDVSLIERVEFIPGPGSALYGGNALLGVVQVITQRADRLGGFQARMGFSPKGQQQGRLSWAQRLDDGSEWLLAYSFDRIPELAQVISALRPFESETRPFDGDEARRLNVAWRSGPFSVRAHATDRLRKLPAYVGELDAFRQSIDLTKIRVLQAGWEGRLGEQWDAAVSLVLQQLDYRRDDPFVLESDGSLQTDRFESLGRWAIVEARAGRDWGDQHALLLGLEAQRDVRQRFRYVLPDGTFNDESDEKRIGLFAQDEWRLGERQRLVSGVRVDRRSGSDWRVSPRLAYVWSPQAGESLKLSWGKAFREANRYEKSLNKDRGLTPPLTEGSRALELSYERPLSDTWKLRGAAYRMALNRPIELQVDNLSINRGDARSVGLDAVLDGRLQGAWFKGWQVQIALTAVRLRLDPEAASTWAPRRQLRWWLGIPVASGLRLDLHGSAQSRRLANRADAPSLPGQGLAHAQLLWEPTRQWQVFVGAQNLGGRIWREPIEGSSGRVWYEHQGTQWQLGATWRP